MKLIYSFILIVFSLNLNAQLTIPDTCITKETIIRTARKIQTLEIENRIAGLKIDKLEKDVTDYKLINMRKTEEIRLSQQEIDIYKNIAEKFTNLPSPDKTRWYNTKTFTFIAGATVGALAVYGGAVVVSKLGD